MAKYLYNGVLLPEIPADVLATHPYCFIRANDSTAYYELYCSSDKPYYANASIQFVSETPRQRYKIAMVQINNATEWGNDGTSTSGVGIDSSRPVMWSNFDIPNGSADSTEIYFYGSEPVDPNAPEEPTEEVYYTISGTRLTGIANQVRRISGVTDELTPEQMETNLLNVEIPEPINLDEEIVAQDDLIAQIQAMLEGKAAGGGSVAAMTQVLITDIPANHIVAECNFDYLTDFKEEIE